MTTTTNPTSIAGNFSSDKVQSTFKIVLFVLALAAAIAIASLNIGTAAVPQPVAVQNPPEGALTLGMIHALESGYQPAAATFQNPPEGALTLGMIHALESGYVPEEK